MSDPSVDADKGQDDEEGKEQLVPPGQVQHVVGESQQDGAEDCGEDGDVSAQILSSGVHSEDEGRSHADHPESNCRGKAHAFGNLLLARLAALLIDIQPEDPFFEHELGNFGNERSRQCPREHSRRKQDRGRDDLNLGEGEEGGEECDGCCERELIHTRNYNEKVALWFLNVSLIKVGGVIYSLVYCAESH